MSSALNIATRAMTVNQSALQVVGHNIANVSTQGYSRQTVSMEVSGYQWMGGNFYGQGVDIASVTRSYDSYLTREARLTSSVASSDSARLARLGQLEDIFPTGDQGLGAAMNEMLNAWADVYASPSDLTARAVVISQGDTLAARMRDTASQVDQLAYSARQQAEDTVSTINGLAKDLAALNQRIIDSQNGSPNDLLDQRDALLAEMSKHLQISSIEDSDGSVNVFVAGSQALVLGTTAGELAAVRDGTDPARLNIEFRNGSTTMALQDSALGGALGGTVSFLNDDLKDTQNLLGRMSLALATVMNTQHNLGMDLNGNTGTDFFVDPAQAISLPGVSNTGDASIHAEVTDPTALQASDYELRVTASGVDVVRMSDGQTTSFGGMPIEIDGLSFELDSGTMAVGDTYLLKPYADVARNLRMSVSAADRLAVASPVVVTPGSANGGGMTIGSLYPVENSANLTDTVTMSFLADGTFTVTGLGPGNPPPDNAGPPASYNYSPGEPLVFNGWSLTLNGSPAAGDTFVISATSTSELAQNGGNATGMLALRDLETFDGVSLSNGYSSLLTDIGTRVQGAEFSSSYSTRIADSAEAARASVSGVNLDEEAARLLQYQQAYQAAAKYMQIVQSTFQTLLSTVT